MLNKKRKNNPNVPKTRKQLRKERRKQKKIKRHEYYTNRRKPGQFVLDTKGRPEENDEKTQNIDTKKKKIHVVPNKLSAEDFRDKEKRQQNKLQKEMNKQRNKQMLEANLEEDRTIKRLEKQLKINKRKSKAIPSSFAVDGLDYLLEVCDSGNLKSSALAEQQLTEVNEEFEEDLALMTESIDATEVVDEYHDNNSEISTEDDSPECGDDLIDDDYLSCGSSNDMKETCSVIKKRSSEKTGEIDIKNCKKVKWSSDMSENSDDDNDDDEDKNSNYSSENEEIADSGDNQGNEKRKNEDGTWEDIYGRLRREDGSVISKTNEKYIPPAARMKMEESVSNKMSDQKLDRLKKQLKGLLNRLAESNMHNITTQIEELYMSNSRNNMNNTITSLIMEALISNILAPERLLIEHVVLIAILHANVGTEVGAHFLQTIVKQFDEYLKIKNVENKMLDNIVLILAQLYNFKLFDSRLIYDVLDKLTSDFDEKNVECILHVLKSVGFSLRKDNPIALKTFILNLQKQASTVTDDLKNNSRVKFMLGVLLAIKNNNVSKIPNYDTSYSEHLKKIMKGFIRKGNYITQLNISLEDLLKVEEKGRWWVIGSAWAGNVTENKDGRNNKEKSTTFSQKLLELARKQRMNTDTRKNIFCIIMSSEDYLDAFEKLLHLSLKNQQEREIIHVILHCCLQEKKYNPFYAVLAQKFCEYDRKYQMTIKYSIWDKLKALKEHSATQISNLAKLLSFLFMEKGLPISILKVVQFSELDKITLRFMRQILLGILLHEDVKICKEVFEKVSQSEQLKMFRESLRLFIHHFLLRNLKSQGIPDDKKELLQERVKIVEKLLTGKENINSYI